MMDAGGLPSGWILCLAGLCGLLILAHFITSFFPHLRVWGINHLAYFPLHIRIIPVVLTLFVFVPKVNQAIREAARKHMSFVGELTSKHQRYLWYAVLSLIAVVVFWIFRSRTYLLGDGFNYVSNLDRGKDIWIWSELLESLLYVQLHNFLNLFWLTDGHLTHQIGSIVAGAIFVFLVFLISDYLARDLFEKILVWVILATAGGVQLFFGYTEHYSFVSLAVLGYLLSSLRWLEKGGKIVILVFLFLLSTALHFSSFFLLPSLVYLFFQAGPKRITAKKLFFLGGGALLAVVLMAIYVYTSKPLLVRIFVLPFEGKFSSGYTSFSSTHLLDILNELLLLSPIGIILILATVLTALSEVHLKDPRILFLLLVVGFGFLFNFTFDPLLGAARDWDMFAITSWGYTILGICFFLKVGPRAKALEYASLILICTSVFSLLPWILLNASEPKSVQRFRNVLELDPQKSKSGRFFLMHYFEEKGMMEEMKKEDLRQMEIYPARYMALQARDYYDRGMPDMALDILSKAVKLDSLSSDIHYHFGKTYFLLGRLDSAEIEYKKALRLKPENIVAYIDLAQIYIRQQLWDKALDQYHMVMKLGIEDPLVYDNVGNIYLSQNRPDQAIKYFRKAIKLKGDLVSARYRLAITLSNTGRADEAIEELEKTIEFNPSLADAYLNLGYLYRDRGQGMKAKASWKRFLELSNDSSKSEEIKNELEGLGSP